MNVISGTLVRVRTRQVAFVDVPIAVRPREVVRRPAKVAQMLALAHHLQNAIDEGVVTDRAEVARKLGFTRARVTQLLNLTLLAPDIQEAVLGLEAVDGVEPMSERGLRALSKGADWAEQREIWGELLVGAAG
jgi:hypothetical protein